MKRYEFHSALPPEEVLSRLREKTRRWSRLDSWTSRNTWFLRESTDGPVRLMLTGRARSYVFADLTLTGTEGGTDIAALMDVAKSLHIGNVAVVLLLVLMAVLRCFLTGSPAGILEVLLRYGWIVPVLIWAGSITGRQLPELSTFIEENLLE